MRISEAYDRAPILPHQTEETSGGCNKVGTQCVNITAPMTLTPTASVGTVTVTCQGSPAMTCVTNEEGTACTLTMTQQVCVSVPIRYGVTTTSGEATIGCADNCVGSGCC